MRGMSKQVQNFTNTFGFGIGEVETLSVKLGLVGNVYRRVHYVIDRHNIDSTTFQTQGRHPGR